STVFAQAGHLVVLVERAPEQFHINALHDADFLIGGIRVFGRSGSLHNRNVVVVVEVILANPPHARYERNDDQDRDNQRPAEEFTASARLLICWFSIRGALGIIGIDRVGGIATGGRNSRARSTSSRGWARIRLNDLRATV